MKRICGPLCVAAYPIALSSYVANFALLILHVFSSGVMKLTNVVTLVSPTSLLTSLCLLLSSWLDGYADSMIPPYPCDIDGRSIQLEWRVGPREREGRGGRGEGG